MKLLDKLDLDILAEARATNSNELTFAAAILERDGKPDKIAHYSDEYGDGEGERLILEFVRRCTRSKALKPGERLRAVRFIITDLPPGIPITEPKGEPLSHAPIGDK